MIWFVLAALSASVAVAYILGKRVGIVQANRAALGKGVLVEVVRPVKCGTGRAQQSIPAGTLAVVTNIDDRWGLSLWIAKPWADEWGSTPAVFMVDDLAGLRVKSDDSSSDLRSQTLAEHDEWRRQLHREHLEAQAARVFGTKQPDV